VRTWWGWRPGRSCFRRLRQESIQPTWAPGCADLRHGGRWLISSMMSPRCPYAVVTFHHPEGDTTSGRSARLAEVSRGSRTSPPPCETVTANSSSRNLLGRAREARPLLCDTGIIFDPIVTVSGAPRSKAGPTFLTLRATPFGLDFLGERRRSLKPYTPQRARQAAYNCLCPSPIDL